MHKRRAFLDAVKTQLVAAGDFQGVWNQRTAPVRNVYPCVTLFAESETVETLTLHPAPRQQRRLLAVSVNVWVRGSVDDEKPEIDMDAYALAVEQTLVAPVGAEALTLVATDYREQDDDPELFVVALSYQLQYQTAERSPE